LDGDGFDFDWGTTNSVMQYNYSHDNGGGGFCLFSPPGYPATQHNVVRYNISAHDVKQNATIGKLGGIMISGVADASSVSFCDIYNNTVYMSAPHAGGIIMLNSADSNFDMSAFMGFYNNTVYSTGTGGALLGLFGQNPNHVVIANNSYHDTKAGDMVLAFSDAAYAVFASSAGSSWQGTAAQPGPGYFDKNADPKFVWEGKTASPSLTGSAPPFETQAGSPLRGQAMTVGSLLSGMPLGTTDFYGVPLPGLTLPKDIGASQALSS
jgi:hypothetical protein